MKRCHRVEPLHDAIRGWEQAHTDVRLLLAGDDPVLHAHQREPIAAHRHLPLHDGGPRPVCPHPLPPYSWLHADVTRLVWK